MSKGSTDVIVKHGGSVSNEAKVLSEYSELGTDGSLIVGSGLFPSSMTPFPLNIAAFILLDRVFHFSFNCPVFFIADLFRPVDSLAIKLLLNGDMNHGHS